MLAIALTAAFIGFIHSLAPGHWLPVVLMARARKWSMGQVVLGAAIASSGHILWSIVLGLVASWVGHQVLQVRMEQMETYGGWFLIGFGLLYSIYALVSHRHCHGHEHHGPEIGKSGKKSGLLPYLFLFSIGFSPCVAALPIFALAQSFGAVGLPLTMGLFAVGVLLAIVGGSVSVSLGVIKLDHPLFEHYGDVITGVVVALMGVFLLVFPHAHNGA